jgi:hypothetical protein
MKQLYNNDTLVHSNTKYIGSLIHCTRAVHKKKERKEPTYGDQGRREHWARPAARGRKEAGGK